MKTINQIIEEEGREYIEELIKKRSLLETRTFCRYYKVEYLEELWYRMIDLEDILYAHGIDAKIEFKEMAFIPSGYSIKCEIMPRDEGKVFFEWKIEWHT